MIHTGKFLLQCGETPALGLGSRDRRSDQKKGDKVFHIAFLNKTQISG
jgi:hypothetical protein